MSNEILFFPQLKRRDNYRIKKDGSDYAYPEYRQEIREDCLGRCVFCDVHENECGGAESIHLDHFRPQKYKEHEHLINDPHNLVWCCSGCNRLKSDDWPALGTTDTVMGSWGYIDPFEQNRREYFLVREDGQIDALKPPAEYTINCLLLNRISRARLREIRILKHRWIIVLEQKVAEVMPILAAANLTDDQRALFIAHIDGLKKSEARTRKCIV